MFTPHPTSPQWAVMGPACYFCTPSPYWTAVKDCVHCLWHMAFPSICRPRTEVVAKQVKSNNPPETHTYRTAHQVARLTSYLPWLDNDSPTRKRSGSFPRHSHTSGTPIPSCRSKQHSKMLSTFWKALDYSWLSFIFQRWPHCMYSPVWSVLLKSIPV